MVTAKEMKMKLISASNNNLQLIQMNLINKYKIHWLILKKYLMEQKILAILNISFHKNLKMNKQNLSTKIIFNRQSIN